MCESTSKHGVTLHNVFERQIANLDVKNMLHPFRRPPIQFLFVFPRSFKLSRGPERVGGGLRPTKTPPPPGENVPARISFFPHMARG